MNDHVSSWVASNKARRLQRMTSGPRFFLKFLLFTCMSTHAMFDCTNLLFAKVLCFLYQECPMAKPLAAHLPGPHMHVPKDSYRKNGVSVLVDAIMTKQRRRTIPLKILCHVNRCWPLSLMGCPRQFFPSCP